MGHKRTPFFDQHVAAGARIVEFAGFDMPIQYEGLMAEHNAVRRSVGLFDVSHMGEIRVRGPKALDAVQHLVSNDVGAIVDGQAQYNCICNEQGGVVDDTVVYRISATDIILCVNAANRDKDWAWVQAHNPFGADMVDEGELWAQVAIQGRNALPTLAKLCDIDLAAIPYYHLVPGVTVAGIDDCIVATTGYTGETGFEIFVPAATAEPLWGAILEAGAEHGIVPVGLGARDTLRLEARFPLYGHELNDETSPLQAGLGWVTKLGKGDFVGRDALLARKGKESHRLVGLIMQGKRIAREQMPVRTEEGEEVGHTTSGTRSPFMGKGIAMAYVRRDLVRPGTRLVVDVRGRPAPCVVAPKGPFFDRDY